MPVVCTPSEYPSYLCCFLLAPLSWYEQCCVLGNFGEVVVTLCRPCTFK